MNGLFMEQKNLKVAYLGDLSGGIASIRIKMEKADSVALVMTVASAAADLVVTLKQSDALTAGNSKDLVRNSKYFKKVGAATSFTAVDVLSTPVAAVTDADFNGAAGTIVFEVKGEDFDFENGYVFFSVNVTLGVVARDAAALFVQGDCKYLPAYTNAV
jgi:hypothetical protein